MIAEPQISQRWGIDCNWILRHRHIMLPRHCYTAKMLSTKYWQTWDIPKESRHQEKKKRRRKRSLHPRGRKGITWSSTLIVIGKTQELISESWGHLLILCVDDVVILYSCISVVFAVLTACLHWCCGWILKTNITLKNTLSIFLDAWVPAKGNHAWGPPALLSVSPELYSPSYWAKLWAHYLSWGLLPFPVLGWRFAHFCFLVLSPTH